MNRREFLKGCLASLFCLGAKNPKSLPVDNAEEGYQEEWIFVQGTNFVTEKIEEWAKADPIQPKLETPYFYYPCPTCNIYSCSPSCDFWWYRDLYQPNTPHPYMPNLGFPFGSPERNHYFEKLAEYEQQIIPLDERTGICQDCTEDYCTKMPIKCFRCEYHQDCLDDCPYCKKETTCPYDGDCNKCRDETQKLLDKLAEEIKKPMPIRCAGCKQSCKGCQETFHHCKTEAPCPEKNTCQGCYNCASCQGCPHGKNCIEV